MERSMSTSIKSKAWNLTILMVVFSFSVSAEAQLTGETLSGQVVDPAKAVVPEARIDIKNNGTGIVRSVVSDGGGLYRAVNFQPGVYTVTVTAPGFSIYVERGLQLTVAATRELASEVRISFSGRKTRKLKAPSIQSCSWLASLTLISILERALSMMSQEQIGFVRICTDASCSRKEQV